MSDSAQGMDRVSADHMGMLATVINALALQDALERAGVFTRVLSAIEMQEVASPSSAAARSGTWRRAGSSIFAAGTGNPYFSTDTAAALRAMEVKADVILKATKVDGIYDADPMKNPKAKKFDRLTYLEVLQKGLKVMDTTAISLCMDNHLPIIVYDLKRKGSLRRIVQGETIGTTGQGVAMPLKQSVADAKTKMRHTVDTRAARARDDAHRAAPRSRCSTTIRVDYYGTPTPLNQVGNLAVPDPTLITLQPWDPALLPAIEKAIRTSDLDLNPQNDGKIIRIPVPSLTEERRKNLVKHRPQARRGGPGRDPQRAPRRQRPPQEAAEGARGQRGRREARPRRGPEADRPAHRGDQRRPQEEGGRDHGGLTLPRAWLAVARGRYQDGSPLPGLTSVPSFRSDPTFPCRFSVEIRTPNQ